MQPNRTQNVSEQVTEILNAGQAVSAATAQLIRDNLPQHLQGIFTSAMSRAKSPQARRVIVRVYADYTGR